MILKTAAALIGLGALAGFYLQQNLFAIAMDAGLVSSNGSDQYCGMGRYSFFLSNSRIDFAYFSLA